MQRLSVLVPFVVLHTAFLLPCQTWTEVGDAGQNLTTANQTTGAGNLAQIAGNLGTDDVDVYLIQIFDTTTFQASTIGGAAFDTQLFLFDQDGKGVTHNDDAPSGGQQSRITGQYVLAPGRYYLAISKYGRDPTAFVGQSPLWNDPPHNTERRPDGPGRNDTLNDWSGASLSAGGAYTISLTGAAFAPNQILLPGNHHLSEGASQTAGSTDWFRSSQSGHFQLLYEGSHFLDAGVNGPVTLTRLQMRAEDTEQNAGGQIYQNVNVKLANTTLTANTLGTSFAGNLNAATTTVGPTAVIAAKTIKRALGLCPNNHVVDIDLQALGIPWTFDPTGSRPNLLVDILWTNAGPGPTGTNTVALQDTTGGPAVVRGRGLTSPTASGTTGTLLDPPVVLFDLLGGGGDDVLVPARVESMGAGCGGSPSSIYQLWPHSEAFDLAGDPLGNGITFTPDVYPAPTRYLVTAGAPPVDLTQVNATPNSIVENATVAQGLVFPFAFPGGQTTVVRFDDNGLVRLTSAAVANTWNPTLDKWLGVTGEGPCFAPFWHDFSCGRNTLTHPNSGLHVRNDASGICWITWLQVGRFNTAATPGGQSVNTMQCRIDPYTGIVQFRYGDMSPITGNTQGGTVTGITGFSRGRIGTVPSVDPGSFDLSRELPRWTSVEGPNRNLWLTANSVVPPVPLHIPGRMFPGQQVRWNVTNIPAGTTFGLQLIDLQASRPGLPLPGITAPGCTLGTSLSALVHEIFVLPPSSVSTAPFVVPPGFDGTKVYAQFAAIEYTPSNFEMWLTNLIEHRVGRQ